MHVKDIIKIMEDLAPIELAESWDNCGLIIGDENQEVKKIFLALDPSENVIDEAIKRKADLLITHHPLLFDGVKKINTSSIEGNKVIKLIKNNLSFYAAHTNLDKAKMGLNDYLCEKLELKEVQIYESTFLRIGKTNKELKLEEFAKRVKLHLNLDYVHYVGDKEKTIKKVGVVSGSGISELSKARAEGIDVFITGDIKYHTALGAKEEGISLIDATHFGTENIVVELLEKYLKDKLKNVELIKDTGSVNPIQFL